MEPAGAARLRGAARRRQSGESAALLCARAARVLTLILAAVILACAAAGLAVTRHYAVLQQDERHAALARALDELHAVTGDAAFDPRELPLIESRAGLTDLRFDAALAADPGREVQSLHDGDGRIVGWFSWAVDRAQERATTRLYVMAAAAATALALCTLLAAWASRRLGAALARSRQMLVRLTATDGLTGLPNRRTMLDRLDDALNARSAGAVAFALLDLDSFHEVNDTLGRAGGDAMIVAVAERLRRHLPAGASLGRFDDDEFAVIVRGEGASAAALSEALGRALADPFYLDQVWQISAGIGTAQAPEDGTTADELVRHAGLALRAAKREGRGAVRRFAPEIHAAHAERRFLRRELEQAVALEAFDVAYQPVVAAAGGKVTGVEALLRWNHPTRGAISPATFIPLAEASGLMNKLGALVLRRALADGARWPGLFVSVNLSPVQIRDPALVDLVAAAMAEAGIAPARVVLEITENILIDDPAETQKRLEALRALGLSIALDDFGTGYSSLSYLQKFPFDRLKIDRAFVASLGAAANAGAIVHSIVNLGHALGMKVLAEGVETDEQRVLLRLAGCDEMQGFLFAKPCPAEAIDRLIARAAAGAAAAPAAPVAAR